MPLKRWEKVCAGLGVLLIATGLLFGRPPADSRRETFIETSAPGAGTSGCRVPATVLPARTLPELGTAVVFHGLAANRRIMTMLGESLAAAGLTTYLIDLPGHGDNTDPFSFARAEECSAAVVEHLLARGEIALDGTVLVGHSLGGDIAIRLADRFTTRATIAISPGPLVPVPGVPAHLYVYAPPKRRPGNLLILFGGLDVPGFEHGARALLAHLRGERTAPEDFAAQQALQLVVVPRTTHTGLVFHSSAIGLTHSWLQRSLGSTKEPARPFRWTRLFSLFSVAGALILFPGLVSLSRVPLQKTSVSVEEGTTPGFLSFAVVWILAALFASVVLALTQLGWLPDLSTGTYLATFFFLAGAVVLTRMRVRFEYRANVALSSADFTTFARRANRAWMVASCAIGAALGLYLVLAVGACLRADWTDLWLNEARWTRFPFMVLAVLPYVWMEDAGLGFPPPGAFACLLRIVRFLVLRGILWATLVFALFVLGSSHILVLVMGLIFALWSVAQRVASDCVRRKLGMPAAAICGAILTAWLLAAVFPLM